MSAKEYLTENHSAQDIHDWFKENHEDEALMEMALILREFADAVIAIRSQVVDLEA